MKVFFDNHWWKNRAWRRYEKLRRGFAVGPIIVLFKDR